MNELAESIPIVLVTGLKGSGKGEFCDALARSLSPFLSPKVNHIGIADPLKEAAHVMLGIPREILWGPSHLRDNTIIYGKTVRYWLQWLGTEVFRDQVHPDIHIDATLRRILAKGREVGGWLLSDCRFPNEYKKVLDVIHLYPGAHLEGVAAPKINQYHEWLVLVTRNGKRPSLAKAGPAQPNQSEKDRAEAHRSEVSMALLCEQYSPIEVHNDGSLADLQAKADKFAEWMLAVREGSYNDEKHSYSF